VASIIFIDFAKTTIPEACAIREVLTGRKYWSYDEVCIDDIDFIISDY